MTSGNEDQEKEMRQRMFAEIIRVNMLKDQERYKELKILVANCDSKDKPEFETKLQRNIESHQSHQEFFELTEEGQQALKHIKEYIGWHSEMKHPDLYFYKKLQSGGI